MDPSIDTSKIEQEEVKESRGEIIFVQIGLTILSGFIFGFIWNGLILKAVKEFKPKFKALLCYIASCVIPYSSLILTMKYRKIIISEAEKLGADVKISRAMLIASSLVFPILPLNFIAMAVLQKGINKLYAKKDQ
jgi:hypothetical protein